MDLHLIFQMIGLAPKAVVFYGLLILIGLLQYNIILIVFAAILDFFDYLYDVMK